MKKEELEFLDAIDSAFEKGESEKHLWCTMETYRQINPTGEIPPNVHIIDDDQDEQDDA